MPALKDRVKKLEDAFIQHLVESGEIRSDLKWLKKAIWYLMGAIVTFGGIVGSGIVRLLWK